ncbi:MAG: sulfotransferase [Chloroflexi bacterium]|nr:sulfotransferase [Chloroflexota bacterium]
MNTADRRLSARLYRWLFARRKTPYAQGAYRMYGALRRLDRPVFVIGMTRSGTTVFSKTLAQTPELLNWSEANRMWDPVGYPFEETKVDRPQWLLDPQGYMDSTFETAGMAYYAAIPGICALHFDVHRGQATRFMNKSPLNTLRVWKIAELFPDARYVNLVRDPRAVLRSWFRHFGKKLNRKEGYGFVEQNGNTLYQLRDRTFTYDELLERFVHAYAYVLDRQITQFYDLPADQHRLVRYEDFCADVHGTLKQVDATLQLDSKLRDWHAIPANYENRNFKFRSEFSPGQIARIEEVCGHIMDRFGYQREAVA